MLKLGPLVLDGAVPRVAVSFSDTAVQADIDEARAAGLDIAEIRIDRFKSADPAYVLSKLKLFCHIPTIATIRIADEGGEWKGSDTERGDLFEAILPHVDAVDIELASKSTLARVGPLARAQGKLLIVSFHDFQATPDLAALKNIVSQAEDAGADIVKVATLITGVDDVRQLAELLIGHQRKNLIVIGIGGEGVITRLLFPGLGSLVTFAYLGNLCTAPGQLPYPAMFEQLRQLYPVYNREKSVGLRLPEQA